MSASTLAARNIPKVPVGTRKNWAFDQVEPSEDHHHSNTSSAQGTARSRSRNPYGWKRDPKSAPGLATLFKPVFSGKSSLEGRNVALERKTENDAGGLESLVPFIYKHEVARRQRSEKDLTALVLDQGTGARKVTTSKLPSRGQRQRQRHGDERGGHGGTSACSSGNVSPEQRGSPLPVQGRPPVPRTPMSDEVLDAVIAELPLGEYAGPDSPSGHIAVGTMFDVAHFPGIGGSGTTIQPNHNPNAHSHAGGPHVHQVHGDSLREFERSVLEVSPIRSHALQGRLRSDSMTSAASLGSVSSMQSGVSQMSIGSLIDNGVIDSQISNMYAHYNQSSQALAAASIDSQLQSKSSGLRTSKRAVYHASQSIPVLNTINKVAKLSNEPKVRKRDRRTGRNTQNVGPVEEDTWAYKPLAANDSAPWVADRQHVNTILPYTGENICQQIQMNHLPMLQQSDDLLSPYSINSVLKPVGKHATHNGSGTATGSGDHDFDGFSVNSSADHMSDTGFSLAGSEVSATSLSSMSKNKVTSAADWQNRKYMLQYCPHDSSAVAKINFQTKKVRPMFEKFSSDCRNSRLNSQFNGAGLQITGGLP